MYSMISSLTRRSVVLLMSEHTSSWEMQSWPLLLGLTAERRPFLDLFPEQHPGFLNNQQVS